MIETIKLTATEYLNLNESNVGFCRECGAENSGVEPDAENYPCELCGEMAVAGTEQLLISGELDITESY